MKDGLGEWIVFLLPKFLLGVDVVVNGLYSCCLNFCLEWMLW